MLGGILSGIGISKSGRVSSSMIGEE